VDRWYYVVARDDEQVLFFADDEDDFGVGRLTTGRMIGDYGLFGDLIDAVRSFLERPA
jgi:hypothetical protein